MQRETVISRRKLWSRPASIAGRMAIWRPGKTVKPYQSLRKQPREKPRGSYIQSAAQRKNEERTEGKIREKVTKEEMDIAELKEFLQALREVQTLIQELPALKP
ncbi:hypothetical protein AVEN_159715-1 [Araneus ventricosus]|uniref:Uncharacterized protein n=1 Tax=Araneus ventricosus TaxID=182803 RepID=A0A4Y2JBF2_ARAVE|nr:hypothetical protein AVEN_159715-1 [Araneus ventricosus]